MDAYQKLCKTIKPGNVYRREDFDRATSGDTDYLLKKLCDQGVLKKMQHGLYYRPALTDFGEKFPNEQLLLKSFLKSDNFLSVSPNDYNSLGLGTTQLYNMTLVYNPKRSGLFEFLGRKYRFSKNLISP